MDQGIGGMDPCREEEGILFREIKVYEAWIPVEKRKGSYSERSRYSIIGQGSPVEKRKGSYLRRDQGIAGQGSSVEKRKGEKLWTEETERSHGPQREEWG